MKKRKRNKRTPEERAAELARREDLTRRLLAAIERYRDRTGTPAVLPSGKPWTEMNPDERNAERARRTDLDRRLLAAIERYRAAGPEAEAS